MKTYEEKIVPSLMKDLEIKNIMRVPRLSKVMVGMCLKEATTDNKVLEKAMQELAAITGQHPKLTRAKKAIATFKLRKGMPLGCIVTLRGARMYEFVERLTSVALPRVRDFRGLPTNGFDGNGNYSMGIKEQIIFPEISFDKIDKPRGLNVTFVTTAADDKEGRALLDQLGLPFRKNT